MIIEEKDYKSRNWAVILTLVYHGLIFLFIFFYYFKTPIPPFPDVAGGSGLEVNFGNSETGFGENNSEQLIDVNTTEVNSSKEDDFVTKDDEESEDVPTSVEKKVKKQVTPQINDPVIKPKINQNALYRGSSSQGIAGGAGNQGKPTGDVNSKSYTGNGGSGGGDGKGNGKGVGDGDGDGNGTKMSPSLQKRSLKLVKPKNVAPKQEGKIVVTVTIDRKGKVLKAKAGETGTTITNPAHWKEAERAALNSQFEAKASDAIEVTGKITYYFYLNN